MHKSAVGLGVKPMKAKPVRRGMGSPSGGRRMMVCLTAKACNLEQLNDTALISSLEDQDDRPNELTLQNAYAVSCVSKLKHFN